MNNNNYKIIFLVILVAILVVVGLSILGGEDKEDQRVVDEAENQAPKEQQAQIEEKEPKKTFAEKVAQEVKGKIFENDLKDFELKSDPQGEVFLEKFGVIDALSKEMETPLFLSQKEREPGEIRIGFITDPQVKSNSDPTGTRFLKEKFVEKIGRFINRMNNSFKPDFIVVNGDVIEGTDRTVEKGKIELALTKELFDKADAKKYWLVGNHDLRAVDKQQFMESLQIDYLSTSFDIGDYKIITVDSSFTRDGEDVVPGTYHTRGHVSSEQIDFLESELKNTTKKPIVFIHNPPLTNIDVKDNGGLIDNSLEVQEVLYDNDAFAVFSGHIERLFFKEVLGTKHFISPGILKNDSHQGTFAEIVIKDENISIDLHYFDEEGEYNVLHIRK